MALQPILRNNAFWSAGNTFPADSEVEMVDKDIKEARGIEADGHSVFTDLVSLASCLVDGDSAQVTPEPDTKKKRTKPYRGRQYSPERREKVIRALTGETNGLRLCQLLKLTNIPKNSLKDLIECLIEQKQLRKIWKGDFWVFTLDPQTNPERLTSELKQMDPKNLIADFNRWRQETRNRKVLPRKLAERLRSRLNSESIESLASRLGCGRKSLTRLIKESLKVGALPAEGADLEGLSCASTNKWRPADLEPLWTELEAWRATRAHENENLPPHIARMLGNAMAGYKKSYLAKVLRIGFSTLNRVERRSVNEEPAPSSEADSEPARLVTLALPTEYADEVIRHLRSRFGFIAEETGGVLLDYQAYPGFSGVKSNVSPV